MREQFVFARFAGQAYGGEDAAAGPAFEALEDCIEAGFDRILTSGRMPTAPEGETLIKQLVERAAGRIAGFLRRKVEKGQLDAEACEAAVGRLKGLIVPQRRDTV